VLFGGYELLAELGRGGMGVVYKARQIALNRPVAIKMLLHGQFSSAAFIDRFHLEAEAAAHLDHPNIVPIYKVGQHGGQPYYSMKLIEGHSLAQEIAEGRWKVADGTGGADKAALRRRQSAIATLVAKLGRAVAFAHQHGVLHRDIKPHNILLDAGGEPHLADFGLAKLLDQESGLTLSAAVIGSPGFMAPEQAAGKTKQVTTAADVYGLGAVLYALLTGNAVFYADTPLETLRQVVDQEPIRPRALNPAVAPDLETVCLKCLQKEPAKRYPSAQALAEDLERWLRAEPIQARRATALERAWLLCRRQPVRASLVGTLTLVLVLGLAGVLWQWRRAQAGELFARQNAYAADMNLVPTALEKGDLGGALAALDRNRPALGQKDLRGWEWRYLWRLCQSKELFTLHQYPQKIGALAVSRGGRLLAVQTSDKAALWDLPGQRPLCELTNVGWGVIAFSPTDSLLAFASLNEQGQPEVRVWNPDSRKLVTAFTNNAPLRCLVFSPDGKLLASLDNKGNIRVTEWASGQILARRTGPPLRRGGVGVLAFAPDGRRLAIGGDAGVLEFLDCQSRDVVTVETPTGDGVTALAFSPSGEVLAAGFGFTSGTIHLWDVSSRQARGQLTNHTAWVTALAFVPDGRRLVSAGMDRTIRVWSIPELAELRRFQASRHGVAALALLPDGKTLATGGDDGTLCLWDLLAPARAPAHTNLVISYGMELESNVGVESYQTRKLDHKVVRRFSLAYAPDGQSLITSDREGCLGVYDAKSLQLIEDLPTLGSNNWAVAFSLDGRWLAVGQASGRIAVWDWKTRTATASLVIAFEWFGRLRFSPSGRFLLANVIFNDRSQTLRIWGTNAWLEVPLQKAILDGLYAAALSPNDKLLAVGYTDGAVRLWKFPFGEPVATLRRHTERIYDLRFSPDGQVLASAGSDGYFGLWDVGARRRLAFLPGDSYSVWGVAFSPDGRRLVTGGSMASDAVRLWDIATQRELLSLPQEGRFFAEVSFSPDGNTLQATSFSGLAHLWRAPSWEEIKGAEKREMPQR
jgi:WD40 repeat protein